jgi:hypothetical protein
VVAIMLIRLIIYVAWAFGMWHLIDFVFDRNQMQGVYPQEADSIAIPIMTNQALVLGLSIFMLPICALGSSWLNRKLGEIHMLFRVLAILVCGAAYAISGLITLAMGLSSLDRAHIELGGGYGLICTLLLVSFIYDSIRIYRSFFQYHFPVP